MAGWNLRFSLVAFAVVLAGCGTSYPVKVNSVAKPEADAISYVLRNANPAEKEDSLRYREAADLVRTALSGRGMYEAPAKVVPDVIVEIDYGVGPPIVKREIRKQSLPKNSPSESSEERIDPNPGRQRDRTGPLSETEFEIVSTTYEKYLRLNARENGVIENGKPAGEVWRIDVTSEGTSRDVRKHLPILVGASIEYIGKDSRGEKILKIRDDDADVVFTKKGLKFTSK